MLCLLLSAAAGSAFAYGGPSPANSVGRGTVPPSSYGTGLVSLPSPTANAGNLVITGNVSGGQYFHDSIPYRSTTSFAAPLGSTELDSFLRYAAGPDVGNGYSSGYSLFYSPTGTVATTPPGYGGAVFAPGSPKVVGGVPALSTERPADVVTMSEISPFPTGGDAADASRDSVGALWRAPAGPSQPTPYWPTPRALEETPQVVPPGLSNSVTRPPSAEQEQTEEPALSVDYRQRLELLRRQIDELKANASELEQSLQTKQVSSVPARETAGTETAVSSHPAALANDPASRKLLSEPPAESPPGQSPAPASPRPDQSSTASQADLGSIRVTDVRWLSQPEPLAGSAIDEPMQARLPNYSPVGNAEETRRQAAPAERSDASWSPQARPSGGGSSPSDEIPALQRVQATVRAFDAPSAFLQRPAQSVAGVPKRTDSRLGSAAGAASAADGVPSLADSLRAAPEGRIRADQPAVSTPPLLGDQILQRYGSANPDLVSRERFEQHLATAEACLKQGRYYQAVDSFTLAAAYQPQDARPYLGRSQALFAAGEYLTSAAFLARAIELDPRVVLGQADLVNAIGGPGVFAGRITDLEECAKAGDVPPLQFLLAYAYLQMGRPAEAKAAIETAEKRLSGTHAVDLLKAAIGGR